MRVLGVSLAFFCHGLQRQHDHEEGRQARGKNHQHLEGAHVCSPASAMPAPVCFFFFFFSSPAGSGFFFPTSRVCFQGDLPNKLEPE